MSKEGSTSDSAEELERLKNRIELLNFEVARLKVLQGQIRNLLGLSEDENFEEGLERFGNEYALTKTENQLLRSMKPHSQPLRLKPRNFIYWLLPQFSWLPAKTKENIARFLRRFFDL